MLDGFQPGATALFFERRRGYAWVAAVALVAGPIVYGFTFEAPEETIEVALEPEIQDFAVEEEAQPEPEPEPPPPPPPNTKVEIVDKPVRRPKIKTPDEKVTDAAEESDKEKVVEVARGPTSPTGTGTRPVESAKPQVKPAQKPEQPEPPKPEKKKEKAIDPTKPVDRPEKATAPEALASNAQPQYPEELRDKGITGRIVIKLHVHRDGSVRGAKVLSKKNNATGEDDKKRADKLFLAAVIKAVKTWKYKPATLEGTAISVWHTVTIPFNLTAG